MSEVHDREREARRVLGYKMRCIAHAYEQPGECENERLLDAYRDAVEARVRWDQQAQAAAADVDPGGAR